MVSPRCCRHQLAPASVQQQSTRSGCDLRPAAPDLHRSLSRGGHALSARLPLRSPLAQHGWTAVRRRTGRQTCRLYLSGADLQQALLSRQSSDRSVVSLAPCCRRFAPAQQQRTGSGSDLCPSEPVSRFKHGCLSCRRWLSTAALPLFSPMHAEPYLGTQLSPARREGLWSGRVAARYANVRSPPTQHYSLRSFYMGGGR